MEGSHGQDQAAARIVSLFLGLALLFGRRAVCHTVCWMAQLVITRRCIRIRILCPALRLAADPSTCASCLARTRNCPMSLDVHAMVQRGQLEDGECILCGTCVDGCTEHAIRFSFSAGT